MAPPLDLDAGSPPLQIQAWVASITSAGELIDPL